MVSPVFKKGNKADRENYRPFLFYLCPLKFLKELSSFDNMIITIKFLTNLNSDFERTGQQFNNS